MEDFNRVEQRQEATTTKGDLGGITNAESSTFFSQDQQNRKQATESLVQNGTLPGLDISSPPTATNTQGDRTAGGTAAGAQQNGEIKPPSPNRDFPQGPGAENTNPSTDRNVRNGGDQSNSGNRDSLGLRPVGPKGDDPASSPSEAPRAPEGDAQSKTGAEPGDTHTPTPRAPESDRPSKNESQPDDKSQNRSDAAPQGDDQSRTGTQRGSASETGKQSPNFFQ